LALRQHRHTTHCASGVGRRWAARQRTARGGSGCHSPQPHLGRGQVSHVHHVDHLRRQLGSVGPCREGTHDARRRIADVATCWQPCPMLLLSSRQPHAEQAHAIAVLYRGQGSPYLFRGLVDIGVDDAGRPTTTNLLPQLLPSSPGQHISPEPMCHAHTHRATTIGRAAVAGRATPAVALWRRRRPIARAI
jgi:hypothetical protein